MVPLGYTLGWLRDSYEAGRNFQNHLYRRSSINILYNYFLKFFTWE